jgi:hypothetical protein
MSHLSGTGRPRIQRNTLEEPKRQENRCHPLIKKNDQEEEGGGVEGGGEAEVGGGTVGDTVGDDTGGDGGMGGDGLAVSRDGSTAMWMIRTSHNPSSWVLTVRSAAVAALSGQSANGFGNVLLTEGRDFNRGFSMSPDCNFFVISLKSGEGYDLFLRDIGTGETISCF